MLTANFFIQATGLARRLSGRWYSPITNCLMNFCKKKIRLKKKIKKSVIVTSIHSSSISAYPAEHHRAYSIMHRWRRREYPGSGTAVWANTHRDARPACLDSRRYELTPRIWLWGSSANIHNKKKKNIFWKTALNLETIETINLDCVSKRGTFTASWTQIQGCVSIKERRKTLNQSRK